MTIYQVDSFSDHAFAGNPAAVCIVSEFPDEATMQAIANEMNLSETAFVQPFGERSGYVLRWFTPSVEVDLCGHATLAAAHVLWKETGLEPDGIIRFETKSGELRASLTPKGLIRLDFPSEEPESVDPPPGLLEALGVEAMYVGANRMDILVEIGDESAVRSLRPDIGTIARVDARGVIVTAVGHGDVDFVSRFFAPQSGVAEDPVTGSAHCCLAPYWADKLGKDSLVAYQASARGGYVFVEISGDRVFLSGYAVTVMKGELYI